MAMNPRILVPRASGFDPRRIAGLIGWWDFSDPALLRQTTAGATAVTADGDVVGYAIDKSGNNRPMASNNDARRPVYKTNILNGKSAVRFDGADDSIGATTHTGTAPDTQTWFGVFANISTATSFRRFFARNSSASLFVNNAAGTPTNQADYWARASTSYGSIALANAVFSLTYTSTAACTVRQNGAVQVNVTTPNSAYRTATTLIAGSDSLSGGNATACDCLEVLIWHVALSATQRSAVERHLASKYGLTLA